MPQISVVMPTYNAAQFVKETIESALQQTFQDFEIVIVDDGSTDNTLEIVKGYAARFPGKIRYFTQENSGSATARNLGIKNSKGELIAFLDADDVWLKEKLERQMSFWKKNPDCDLIYANADVITAEGRYKWPYIKKREFNFQPKEMYVRLLIRNFIPLSSILARKSALQDIGGFDAVVWSSEDSDLLLRFSKIYILRYLNETLVKYRVSPTNKSSNRERRHRSVIRNMTVHYDGTLVESFYFRLLIRRRLAQAHYALGYTLFEKNDLMGARKSFFESILLWPTLYFCQFFYFWATFIPVNILEWLRLFKRTIVGQLKNHAKS